MPEARCNMILPVRALHMACQDHRPCFYAASSSRSSKFAWAKKSPSQITNFRISTFAVNSSVGASETSDEVIVYTEDDWIKDWTDAIRACTTSCGIMFCLWMKASAWNQRNYMWPSSWIIIIWLISNYKRILLLCSWIRIMGSWMILAIW